MKMDQCLISVAAYRNVAGGAQQLIINGVMWLMSAMANVSVMYLCQWRKCQLANGGSYVASMASISAAAGVMANVSQYNGINIVMNKWRNENGQLMA
jgi:hypothetical protein